MRKMENYFDPFGFIVTMPDKDGGDSAHNHGMYRFARYLIHRENKEQLSRERAKYDQECDGLEDLKKKNWYRRHPDSAYWYSKSNNFTRDQQRPMVIAMGALGLKKRLCGLFWEHIKRFGFYQNTRHPDETRGWKVPDFAAPNHWGEYIRAFYMLGSVFKLTAILYPVLILCDVFGLIGLLANKKKWKDPEHADDDNMIISLLQARIALPTPISSFTRKLYIRIRPLAGFIDADRTLPLRNALGNKDLTGPESCLLWKHHQINQGPPLYECYVDIMKKYMRN